MFLWGQKDRDVSLDNFPLPFNILSLQGGWRWILSRFLPHSAWLCISIGQIPTLPVPIQYEQWQSVRGSLQYTHRHAHTCAHIYEFVYLFRNRVGVERKMICIWYLQITWFLNFILSISEEEIKGSPHGWGGLTDLRSTRELTLVPKSRTRPRQERESGQWGLQGTPGCRGEGEPARGEGWLLPLPSHQPQELLRPWQDHLRTVGGHILVSYRWSGCHTQTGECNHPDKTCALIFFLNLVVLKNCIRKSIRVHI